MAFVWSDNFQTVKPTESALAFGRSGRLHASNTARVLWLLVTVTGHAARAEPGSDNTLLQQGYAYMYNLQFEAAHRVLHQYEQSHPKDPMGPVSDAAAYLFYAFDELKLLRSDRFLDDQKFLSATKSNADPLTTRAFEQALEKGRELVEKALHNSPGDKNALLANVIRITLQSDYDALIEKQYWRALQEIKQSQRDADKLLAICPKCYDANLAIGVENYLLSLRPAPERWLLRLTGAQTSKEKGLQKLTVVAQKGRFLQPYANFLLVIAALRDKKPAEAKRLLSGLVHEFPQNSMFRSELEKLG
jgi:hypothetical protein